MMATLARVPLALLDDLPLGLGRAFEIQGKTIAVFRSRDDQIYAVEGVCPHKGGPLADGMLIGDQIVCPLHGYRYHGSSGECDQPGTCSIQAYATVLDDTQVYLMVPTE
jgi:nitrite reductase (NADH) small subunit